MGIWKLANACTINILEGERGDKAEKVFEDTMAESFSSLTKDTNLQHQEAERKPNRINPKKSILRHITVELLKNNVKEKILKAARVKRELIYRGETVRKREAFSSDTMEARGSGRMLFKC